MTEQKIGRILASAGTVLIVLALLIVGGNIREDEQAGKASQEIGEKVEALTTDTDASAVADTMETVQVEGHSYIGMISIPALNIELPVMDSWSLPNLKIAPCRYKGTVQGNDLIICAHNYRKHFGLLNTLDIGDEVVFQDVRGMQTAYRITEITLLQPDQVREMEEGDWDLTLFSCTYMGYARVTVRCRRAS